MNWTAAFRALIGDGGSIGITDTRSPSHILSAKTRKDNHRKLCIERARDMREHLVREGVL